MKLEKMYRIVEIKEGERTELDRVVGPVMNVKNRLQNNTHWYDWQLDEDKNAEQPDFTDCDNLKNIQKELEKISLGWWDIAVEEITIAEREYEELLRLDNKVLTEEELEELQLHEFVTHCEKYYENLGESYSNPGFGWWDILIEAEEDNPDLTARIDVFVKIED